MFPLPDAETCVMYLLRHGATANNTARPPRLQGRDAHVGLSPDGIEQARQAAAVLAGLPLHGAYSSPLARAAQTARVILDGHPLGSELALEQIQALVEVDVGQWEGKSWIEIESEDAEAYRLFLDQPAMHPYRGGENLTQVRDRVLPAVYDLMQANSGRAILVVGHNVVNRAILAHLTDVPLNRARTIPQDNCGINVIRYRRGEFQVVTVNSVFHLRAV